MPDDVDRIDLRRVGSNWVNPIIAIVFGTLALVLFPWQSTLPILLFAVYGLGRVVIRQATLISFDPMGVEVRLLFRKRHIRRPVAEFNGSRARGVIVHDLHTDKSYDLALTRNARVVHAIESHGYAVLRRPADAFR